MGVSIRISKLHRRLPATSTNTVAVTMAAVHLHEELAQNPARVLVETRYGTIRGGRAANGAAIFLGKLWFHIFLLYSYSCIATCELLFCTGRGAIRIAAGTLRRR